MKVDRLLRLTVCS